MLKTVEAHNRTDRMSSGEFAHASSLRLLNPHGRKAVAHHGMGHALVAMALSGTDPVSIIPRGIGSLGYTIQRPTEDCFLMSRTELDNNLAVLLAGRAAESICFSEASTSAADDLKTFKPARLVTDQRM